MSRTLYNPLLEDFSVDVDRYGPNHQVLTIKAGDVKVFKKDWQAKHLKRHLVNKLLGLHPPKNKNKYAKRKELEKIVEVK